MHVRPIQPRDREEWRRMRMALWPDDEGEHDRHIERFFEERDATQAVFVAQRVTGELGGVLEASTRAWAEGCRSSPVGYIEGWWVDADLRRSGVGAMLVAAAEDWARSRGLTEMGSDAELSNETSRVAHRALGYAEIEQVVCFAKRL